MLFISDFSDDDPLLMGTIRTNWLLEISFKFFPRFLVVL